MMQARNRNMRMVQNDGAFNRAQKTVCRRDSPKWFEKPVK